MTTCVIRVGQCKTSALTHHSIKRKTVKEIREKAVDVNDINACIKSDEISGRNICECYPYFTEVYTDKGHRSRYSDWLQAGRPRGRSSSLSRVKNFLFSTSSRPALVPTQPPTQWVPGSCFLWGKVAGA
jgi:hypothetical protein